MNEIKEKIMNNMPGFNGEASLSPTMGKYRGKAGFGGSGKAEVLPSFWGYQNTIRCCSWVGGHIYCNTFRVPIYENCKCKGGVPVCTPPVLQQS
jgi:hypothetical protein